MSQIRMKLVTIPTRKIKQYDNFKQYAEEYLEKVQMVLQGIEVSGVENDDAKDIDYAYILNKMKNEAINNFPDEFNMFPESVENIKELEDFVNGYVANAYSSKPTVPRLGIICRDCGKEFRMFNWDIEFYEKNGYSIPKRCKECRAARRAARETN